MSDMFLIQGAISGLKSAADMAIGLSKLNTLAEVQGKAVELQQIILSAQASALNAQSQQFSLLNDVDSLKKEIAQIKAWEETKQRYLLYSPFAGTFAYALKKDSGTSEPAHWICANCYEKSRKSILQKFLGENRRWLYRCPECKSEIHLRGDIYDPSYV